MIGEGAHTLVRRALAATPGAADDRLVDSCHRRFVEHYTARPAEHSRAYPGAHDCLAALKAAEVSLGVCTNKPERISRLVLDGLGLSEFFGIIVGGDTLKVRKPHTDHLLAALSRLRATPGEAVMVGDSPTDRDAARNAAVQFIAVSYGYSPVPPERLGAEQIIDRLDRLPSVLATLGQRL